MGRQIHGSLEGGGWWGGGLQEEVKWEEKTCENKPTAGNDPTQSETLLLPRLIYPE